MNDQRIIGHRIPRKDALQRVTGDLVYGMDVRLPGMLYGKILRSPLPHAMITRLDVTRAKALPGVRAVLTAHDVPDTRMPFVVLDRPLLAIDRVRFMGEPIVLVAATTPEIAEQALNLIEIEYSPLPIVSDPEEALKPGAPLLHENWQSYTAPQDMERGGNLACHCWLSKGDIDQAFGQADFIVEDRYTTRSVHQMHLELRAVVANVDSSGKVTIYSNTQVPNYIRSLTSTILNIPESQICIITPGIGGGFGAKLHPSFEHYATLLAQATRRPVRMASTIGEELTGALPRHPCTFEIKTGVAKDGTILARYARLVFDTGAYAGDGPAIAGVGVLAMAGPYKIPNLQIHGYVVYTNKTDFGPMRAPGGVQPNFALESHMDHVAEVISMDPLDFRLKNIVAEGEKGPNGQVMEGVGLRECMEKAAEAIEWKKPSQPNRGKGLAIGWWATAMGSSSCYAKLQPDGKIFLNIGATEIGTGAVSQGAPFVLAEALGVDIEDIILSQPNTDTTPYDAGSDGSHTQFIVGNAALRIADDLKRKLIELASQVLQAPPEALALGDKAVYVEDAPHIRISLAELAKISNSEKGGIVASGSHARPAISYDEANLHSILIPTFPSPCLWCHAAEVEVDPLTGAVTVLRYIAAHDVGRAINPMGIEGQIHGGVAQGIGMALMEEIIYEDGRVINPNLTDYKLPTIVDVPDIQCIIVEHPTLEGPFGAKGMGESTTITPPATLANAIYRACGARVTSLPMTPEKVLNAIPRR
jgi:CO/xanthine dehydrogenase Mo-binding subunit